MLLMYSYPYCFKVLKTCSINPRETIENQPEFVVSEEENEVPSQYHKTSQATLQAIENEIEKGTTGTNLYR